MDVKNNQAVFDGLNATSFITSAGVSEGAAALAAIQMTANCGSRSYTLVNVSACLIYCTVTADINNCKKAIAYAPPPLALTPLFRYKF